MPVEPLTATEINRRRAPKPDYIRRTLLELLRHLPELQPGQEIHVRVPVLSAPVLYPPNPDAAIIQYFASVRRQGASYVFLIPELRNAG